MLCLLERRQVKSAYRFQTFASFPKSSTKRKYIDTCGIAPVIIAPQSLSKRTRSDFWLVNKFNH